MLSRQQLGQLAITLGGVPVWGCLPGSVAQQAGIRYGDVLLSVNGKATANMADFVDARALCADSITIVFFRNGENLTANLALHTEPEPLTRERIERVASEISQAKLIPTDPEKSPSGAAPN